MGLFGKPKSASVAVFDIAADSVAGGYVVKEAGKPSLLVYAHREPFAIRLDQGPQDTFTRALSTLGELMIREGAPALARVSGSGRIFQVVASLAPPWSDATIHIERLVGDKGPFVFNQAAIDAAQKPPKDLPPEHLYLGDEMLATFLDGYASKQPVGERTHRASIIFLSATALKGIAEPLAASLRGLYHTHNISLTARASTLYHGLTALFPHEDDYLALSVSGRYATLLLIRRAVALAAMSVSLAPDSTAALFAAFSELAKTQPLAHSVFIVAEEAMQAELKQVLGDPRFAPLWLSDNPPRILPVRAEHLQLGGKLALAGDIALDLPLGLLAIAGDSV